MEAGWQRVMDMWWAGPRYKCRHALRIAVRLFEFRDDFITADRMSWNVIRDAGGEKEREIERGRDRETTTMLCYNSGLFI